MKIFLDMDGTICDWEGAVRKLGPDLVKGIGDTAKEEDVQAMCKAINEAGENFWAEMDFAPDGRELWHIFRPFHPTILSSPGDFPDAAAGKLAWIRSHIPGTTLYLSKTKTEFIDPYDTSVLVDDNKNIISAWEECGGIGILHQSLENTEKQFLELLWNDPPDIDLKQHF